MRTSHELSAAARRRVARRRRPVAQVGRGGVRMADRTAATRSARPGSAPTPRFPSTSMSKPGFELQWTTKLDNRTRRLNGLHAGRHGQRRHAVRADVGRRRQLEQHLRARQRHRLRRLAAAFDAPLPGGDGGVPRRHHGGGDAHRAARRRRPITAPPAVAAARGAQSAIAASSANPARACRSKRAAAGRGRGGAPAAGAAAPPARRRRAQPAGAPPRRPVPPPARRCPGRAHPPRLLRRQRGAGGAPGRRRWRWWRRAAVAQAARHSGRAGDRRAAADWDVPPASSTPCRATACCTCSVCRPARTSRSRRRSCPRTREWSDTDRGRTRRSTPRRPATAAARRTAVWAIDLGQRRQTGRVVEERTAAPIVGARRVRDRRHASSRRSVPAPRPADGKVNAIVALDPKTLQVKDWFTQPGVEFVTGPTVFRHNDRDIVAAATKDGRVLLLERGVTRRRESRDAALRLDRARGGHIDQRAGDLAGTDDHARRRPRPRAQHHRPRDRPPRRRSRRSPMGRGGSSPRRRTA